MDAGLEHGAASPADPYSAGDLFDRQVSGVIGVGVAEDHLGGGHITGGGVRRDGAECLAQQFVAHGSGGVQHNPEGAPGVSVHRATTSPVAGCSVCWPAAVTGGRRSGVGQQADDGADGGVEVFASAVVAARIRQFLRCPMACSTRIRWEECRLRAA